MGRYAVHTYFRTKNMNIARPSDPALALKKILTGCLQGRSVYFEQSSQNDIIGQFEGEESFFDLGRLTAFYSFLRQSLQANVEIIGGHSGCIIIHYRTFAPQADILALMYDSVLGQKAQLHGRRLDHQRSKFGTAEVMGSLNISSIKYRGHQVSLGGKSTTPSRDVLRILAA